MTRLFLPPSVSRELRERTQSFNAAVRASVRDYDATDPILREYNQRLADYDPRLLMVRASDRIVPGLPMKAGYYHIIRDNSETGAPDTVMIVEGEHGEFVVPTSRVFEKLAAGDLHDDRNLRRFLEHQQAEHDRVEREKQADRAERREHLGELVDAYTRTSVPGTGVGPWRQNQKGHEHGGRP